MRQRTVKNLEERLESNSSFLIKEPRDAKGHWAEIFGNNNPVYLEIGCGKGQFILTRARNNGEANYIAVEGQENVILRAMEKAEQAIAQINAQSEAANQNRIKAQAEYDNYTAYIADVNRTKEERELQVLALQQREKELLDKMAEDDRLAEELTCAIAAGEDHQGSGEQQLPTPPRVFHVDGLFPSLKLHGCHEAIEPLQESGAGHGLILHRFLRKTEDGRLPLGSPRPSVRVISIWLKIRL